MTSSSLALTHKNRYPISSSKGCPNLILIYNPLSVRRPLVHTQYLRVTTTQCHFQSIILLPRIPCSPCSPQVSPSRITSFKEFRDTCRLNSTKAWGFTIPLIEASLPALLQ
ncbi:hypothetical protein QL285_028782 [Trifolium repens]|nr:hypothetical protein QL285_028782 [Trifolium repens]